MVSGEEQRETLQQPLVGEITQVLNIKKEGGIVYFPGKGTSLAAVWMPETQVELIKKFLLEKKEKKEKLFLWIYKTRRTEESPWRGIVVAGPFGDQVEKNTALLDEEQRSRWINRLIDPLNGITQVEEINVIEELSFKVRGIANVGFKEIWGALNKEAKRRKEGEKMERGYETARKRLGPMKGIRGEAFRRSRE